MEPICRPDPTRPGVMWSGVASYGYMDLDVFSVLDINPASFLACFSFFSLDMLDRAVLSPDAERGFLAITGSLFGQLSALTGQFAHRGTFRAFGPTKPWV